MRARQHVGGMRIGTCGADMPAPPRCSKTYWDQNTRSPTTELEGIECFPQKRHDRLACKMSPVARHLTSLARVCPARGDLPRSMFTVQRTAWPASRTPSTGTAAPPPRSAAAVGRPSAAQHHRSSIYRRKANTNSDVWQLTWQLPLPGALLQGAARCRAEKSNCTSSHNSRVDIRLCEATISPAAVGTATS